VLGVAVDAVVSTGFAVAGSLLVADVVGSTSVVVSGVSHVVLSSVEAVDALASHPPAISTAAPATAHNPRNTMQVLTLVGVVWFPIESKMASRLPDQNCR
jgi:hypothetical protein